MHTNEGIVHAIDCAEMLSLIRYFHTHTVNQFIAVLTGLAFRKVCFSFTRNVGLPWKGISE